MGLIRGWVAPSDNGGTPMLSYRADASSGADYWRLGIVRPDIADAAHGDAGAAEA
jgi:hypothetical protein